MKKLFFFLFVLYSANAFAQTDTVTKTTSAYCDSCIYELSTVDVPPVYPGGDEALFQFIKTHITYPVAARELGVQGKVFVEYILDTTGKITNVRVYRGVKVPIGDTEAETQQYIEAAKALDNESIRIVKLLPSFSSPGKKNGKPVKVRMLYPFSYKLT